ncbi:UNVERIFIED_CONTAM: hypothetical protein Sradi_4467600 [Sesamum radiatum]|uniref:Uncharacterized protein n=1 Tax=Sesamum radiatum TaxID=300843 RepID=A0AAW2N8T5_SESRA
MRQFTTPSPSPWFKRRRISGSMIVLYSYSRSLRTNLDPVECADIDDATEAAACHAPCSMLHAPCSMIMKLKELAYFKLMCWTWDKK